MLGSTMTAWKNDFVWYGLMPPSTYEVLINVNLTENMPQILLSHLFSVK
jgi:hypothetical protein